MLIKFTSNINNNNKKNKIEFTSKVKISTWNEFKVYEFLEPSMNEMNRIEVSENAVNIITGINTLNLSLNKKIPIEYIVHGSGSLYLDTKMHNLSIKENIIEFNYSLFNDKNQIGLYELKLELIENAT